MHIFQYISDEKMINIPREGPGYHMPWSKNQPMNVLISGGLSPLGFHLASRLLTEGHAVTLLDRINEGDTAHSSSQLKLLRLWQLEKMSSSSLTITDSDPCDLSHDQLAEKLAAGAITHVVFITPDSFGSCLPQHRDQMTNRSVGCITRVLEYLQWTSTPVHFTAILKTTVYDEKAEDAARPRSNRKSIPLAIHAIMLGLMENIIKVYNTNHNQSVAILKLSHVYGPWCDIQHPMFKMLDGARHAHDENATCSRENLGISFDDYHSVQDFLYVDDAIGAILKALYRRDFNGLFYVESGEVSSLEKVHNTLFKITNIRSPKQQVQRSNHAVPPFQYFKEPCSDALAINPPVTHLGNNALISFSSSTKVNLDTGLTKVLQWYEEHRDHIFPDGKHDFIFTTFYTTKGDPQRGGRRKNDDSNYMSRWYRTLCGVNLRGVVFHDALSEGFKKRFNKNHVTFELSPPGERTTNDARFYAYRNYLLRTPAVQRAFFTDISDVTFLKNPFQLIDILGDFLYIGTDANIRVGAMGWLNSRFKACFTKNSYFNDLPTIKRHYIVYNAGVIGGTRSMLLAFLGRLIEAFDNTPKKANCNMGVVNYVVHKYFDDVVYTGFPVTNRFKKYRRYAKGVYITHK